MMRRRERRAAPVAAMDMTTLDLPHIQPRLTMLSQEDCRRIHEASCRILERTGVKVYHEGGLQLLRQAGARVEGDWVRIPSELVEWALASAPRAFALYRRGSDQVACQLDGEHVYFGPGSDTLRYLDPRSGERREFTTADIADCIRVCDYLPEIDFVMSVGIPRDVPTKYYFRYQYAVLLRHTVKPAVVVCNDLADIEAITAMHAAAAGGLDQLSRYPTMLLYSEPTTPLSHAYEAVDKLLFVARHRIPVTHSPAPMIGGTAPITLAGAVALGNAEMLSGLVMHQLQNPGAPFLYGHGVHHLDMKEMISVYGAPEFQLARVMAAEMARFYRLPCWGYAAHSDSAVLDEQAAIDAQFSIQTALLAKTNLNHDVGYLEAGLANSPEYMVLANELIAMNRVFVRGVRIDDEALALDVIDAVGPGGQFLSHEHTMRHWRELWVPELFDRQRLEPWLAKGGKDMRARVREKTLAILDSHQPEPLPATVEAEIEHILQRRD
jgi:trimethylamine--corrinoid protein Co-methyltransferase